MREGKVLLLRRAMEPYEGYWDVPGGFCDAAEHPMRAAERELAEELGLSARAIDLHRGVDRRLRAARRRRRPACTASRART